MFEPGKVLVKSQTNACTPPLCRCKSTKTVVALQFRRAEAVQELIREIRRLLDVLIVHQAEAAVERLPARTGFFKDVRERPVGHGLRGVTAVLELVNDVGRAVVAVVKRIGRRVGAAPFGEVEFQLGKRGFGDHAGAPI